MIPVTYPSSVSTSKESQMVVYSLSSVAGLQRWTDYIPVKYQSTGSDVPNSFNTNGYIACDFITNLTGKQAWVDYIPVFVDNLATTAWQVSDTGFIPFNTLAGGGTYVSLDLNFLNTTALDSRITFSRGTNATLTDSNGRIAWAPHNLLTNSEDFEAAAWVKDRVNVTSNTVVAPDGTTTADKVTDTAAGANTYRIYNSVTLVAQPYTMTVYAKAAEYSWCYLRIGNALRAWYNLANGTVGTVDAGLTASVSDAGNGWYRLTCTIATATAGAGFGLVGLATGNGVESYTPTTGGMGIFIWGAQLNVGSTAQSYNSTTPKNLLGFTQEPENAAWTKSNSYVQQNLLTWSQDFDNAAWTKTELNTTGTPPWVNVAVAPDGTTTAEKLIATNINTAHDLYSSAVTLAGNTAYSYSLYAKAGELSNVSLAVNSASNWVASPNASFDLTTGTKTSGSAAATITPVGNGWYRLTLTGTTVATPAGERMWVRLGSFAGNGTDGIFIWGAQLVQGSTAGDYTQTTSAAAPTRYTNWDGTLTGRKLVEDTATAAHSVYRSVGTLTGTHTASCYVQAAGRTWCYMEPLGNTATRTYFNLSGSGSVGTTGAGVTASITAVGGGWFRIATIYTYAATGFVAVGVTTGDAVVSYTGDGTSGIYVSDFQLSNSASVDPYVYNPQAAAASAAYYGPRFDYDPVTLAAKGLLIEEQRTNLLTYSEQFDNAAWVKVASTVTSNAAVAPDGSNTADALIADTANSQHRVDLTPVSPAGVQTFSVYAKASGYSLIAIRINLVGAVFDLSTGNYASSLNTPVSYSSTSVGNGWYRLTVTVNASANDLVRINVTNNSLNNPFVGDGTSGIFIWGAQLEVGAFATSYIPTVASQVTRNADSASMLGDNFYTWYNPNQGTLSVESNRIGTAMTSAMITDGSLNNFVGLYTNSSGVFQGAVSSGGVSQAGFNSGATSVGTPYKVALAFKANDFAYSFNGAAALTDTSGSIPVVNVLGLGQFTNGSGYGNGHIRRIGYYNTRLPDSTLQALTT